MIFGLPSDFAIEAYHEPSGPQWAGFGRMAIDIQGFRLGDIRENHCSLFHAADRFRELHSTVTTLWDESFAGLSNSEIFGLFDHACYTGDPAAGGPGFSSFDFLTNTGEHFDDVKTFIVCRPEGRVHILYQLRDGTLGSESCPVESFRTVAESFVRWLDEQVRTIAPPVAPIDSAAKSSMRRNRSIPEAVVIPELGYVDVPAAAQWLCDKFGFRERLRIANHRIQLSLGAGAVVVTERNPDAPQADSAHSVLVRIEDIDTHYANALAVAVRIIRPPQTYPFGERQYTAEDCGGHVWTFSQTIDDIDPASWGGILHDH